MIGKVSTGTTVILAVAAVAVVYLMTRKPATNYPPTTYVPPPPETAKSQLAAWAQTQQGSTDWLNLIANLPYKDIVNLWNDIFGKGDSDTTGGYGYDFDDYGYV